MICNLTEKQKGIARRVVDALRAEEIDETFAVGRHRTGGVSFRKKGAVAYGPGFPGTIPAFLSLVAAGLLLDNGSINGGHVFTVTGSLYRVVDASFEDGQDTIPLSTIALPHPAEIALSLDRLRAKYADPKKLGFLIMRFAAAKPFSRIVTVIRTAAQKHGLTVLRADDQEFHADLWGNVRTYLHGCGFGIAVYERIETDEPNANMGLEVGYLLAMNKPVLLLKDQTLPSMQSDLAGKLYKPFDPHDPESTLPPLLERWLLDYGIVVTGGAQKPVIPASLG